ncbi:hypothetical protein FRB98_000678 [Tulasnella sp. 332]|nr:hypothetical protein FRB98_000678 [Tulasnella sp. 332]
MFGETDSESPRMPSPWEGLSVAPSPSPSPLTLSAGPTSNNSTTTLTENASAAIHPRPICDAHPTTMQDHKYLDIARTSEYAPSGLSSSLLASQTDAFPKLAPEIEEGNVEYKLKLIDPSPSRFARLVTQLKYRLLEGGGQALYEIGVSDFGDLVGLSRNDLEASLDTLDRMAGELGATVIVLKEIELPKGVSGKLPGAQVGFAMGPREQSTPYTKTVGKKDRDKEARRVRRAAALVADVVVVKGDTADATTLTGSQDELSSPGAPANPRSDSDDAATTDLSRTITLSPPAPPSSSIAVFSTQPMPIITNYPYGRHPFTISKAQTGGRSVSSSLGCATVSSVSSNGSFVSGPRSPSSTSFNTTELTSELDDNAYAYMPASISVSASSDDHGRRFGGRKVDDEGGDPAFDYAFDLEAASFATKSEANPNQSKPLHYSSFAYRSSGHEPGSLLAAEDALSFMDIRPLKSARPKKKPIIPTPPSQDPAVKAAGKRMKRDARRDERQRLQLEPPPFREDPSPQPSVPSPPLSAQSKDDRFGPSIHIENKGNGVFGPRVIAEALVVRKLALEEAFLDFGGFSLVEGLSSVAAAAAADVGL